MTLKLPPEAMAAFVRPHAEILRDIAAVQGNAKSYVRVIDSLFKIADLSIHGGTFVRTDLGPETPLVDIFSLRSFLGKLTQELLELGYIEGAGRLPTRKPSDIFRAAPHFTNLTAGHNEFRADVLGINDVTDPIGMATEAFAAVPGLESAPPLHPDTMLHRGLGMVAARVGVDLNQQEQFVITRVSY